MLPTNPFPENFHQLLDIFKSSQRIHRLIKLNLIAGANFALACIPKWKAHTDFETISKGFPLHRYKGVLMRVHVDAVLEAAKRMIDSLLEADAVFFKEHNYFDPLLSVLQIH
jgi:hypothetical protein